MRPLRNNVVVAQREKEKTTQAGIILTEAVETGQTDGIVVGIGPECKDVEVGQSVIPDWSKGRSVTIGDIQAVIISEDDILAILGEE
jgi:chaperonin GroES